MTNYEDVQQFRRSNLALWVVWYAGNALALEIEARVLCRGCLNLAYWWRLPEDPVAYQSSRTMELVFDQATSSP